MIHTIHSAILISIVLNEHIHFPTFGRLKVKTLTSLHIYTERFKESNCEANSLRVKIPINGAFRKLSIPIVTVKQHGSFDGIVCRWSFRLVFSRSLTYSFNSDPIPCWCDNLVTV